MKPHTEKKTGLDSFITNFSKHLHNINIMETKINIINLLILYNLYQRIEKEEIFFNSISKFRITLI